MTRGDEADDEGADSAGPQRVDKWLWHARVVRTRSGAADLAKGGHVRLNGARIRAASQLVRAGDVLTIALDARVKLLRVRGFAERRGSAPDAQALYEDVEADPAPAGARRSDP